MKKLNHIFLTSVILAGLSSCANEAPFWEKQVDGEGKILTSSLTVKVKTDENLVRAESGTPDVGQFTVDFIDPDDTESSVIKRYVYEKMPEVVTLPVGTYQVKAYYGGTYPEDATAAFDAPYYLGYSSNFTIESNKIIDDIQPIECKLANVKVTILFDEYLVKNMSPNSTVEVTVGNSSPLIYGANEARSGFFKFTEGSTTLVAKFSGVVEGEETVETKLYQNVSPGTHYRITFMLHSIDPNEPGNINPGGDGEDPIKIDASVNLEDLTGDGGENIIPDKEYFLEDDRYPGEVSGPDVPDPDDPLTGTGPEVTCEGAQFDVPNKVSEMDGCSIVVKSESGLKVFSVTIDSNKLTPEELDGVGLTDKLDLITPGEFLGPLQNFGFLDKDTDQKTLEGEKDVKLDLSPFLGLLQMLGAGTHNFILTIGDDSGTTVKKLILITEEEE